jgi:hypothetical protein
MKTSIEIPDTLLLLLDGRGDEKVQAAVNAAKARAEAAVELTGLTEEQIAFVVKVRTAAETSGQLWFQHNQVKSCGICKKRGDYIRFKSGPRKGQPNYDKPTYLNGVELMRSFVSMQGYVNLGCCFECWTALKPVVAERLVGVRAEIPEHITGTPPRFKRYDLRHCKKCDWTGSERLMGKERTLMGDGWYPASCPKCGAKNLFMGPTVVETVKGFEIYELPTATPAP